MSSTTSAHWVALADGPYPAASLAHYAEDYGLARDLGFRTILTGEHAEFVFALNWYLIDHYLSHGTARRPRATPECASCTGAPWRWLAFDVARGIAPGRLLAARERRTRLGLPAWIDGVKASEGTAQGIASVRRALAATAARGISRPRSFRGGGGDLPGRVRGAGPPPLDRCRPI